MFTKFKKTEIISNNLSQQRYEARNQQQESWKIHKEVEIKQPVHIQPVHQRRNEKQFKYLEKNETETQHNKGDTAKAVGIQCRHQRRRLSNNLTYTPRKQKKEPTAQSSKGRR